jgi:predicted DNA-binding protein
MPISLRIPTEKEKKIKKVAARPGKTKTAFILEAVDEKLGLRKGREQVVRELAGWMGHEEAEDLRKAVAPSRRIRPGDWK